MKIRMRDGTGTIDLNFVVEDVDRHGNVRVYFRRRGYKKVRIRETPGTEEFMAAYRAALADGGVIPAGVRDAAAPGSLRRLVEKYYRSAEYRLLAESTRRVRKGILDGMCTEHGAKQFAQMEPRHVCALRDQKAEYPEAANARVKALRQVFAWAMDAGHASRNPARDAKYLRTKSSGFHTWTVDEVCQFEARHSVGTKARLALGLILYTGVRRSDAVRLGRQMERDGWLRFTVAKTGQEHEVPILPQLRELIDATPSGHLTYITTKFGKPFTPAGFGNWFRRRCDEAGLRHCSAHGLRKAGATIAANNGATEHQLMAMFGWDSPKQAAVYTRKVNRRRLAGEGMHKIVPSVPPSDPTVSHRRSSR